MLRKWVKEGHVIQLQGPHNRIEISEILYITFNGFAVCIKFLVEETKVCPGFQKKRKLKTNYVLPHLYTLMICRILIHEMALITLQLQFD